MSPDKIKEQVRSSSYGQRGADFYYRVFNYGTVGELSRDKKILDVGSCNSNFVTANRYARLAVGIDPGYQQTKPTDKTSKAAAVAQYLPFSDGAFDEVVASHVLMFMGRKDIPDILLEMCRATRTFGRVKVYPVYPHNRARPALPPYIGIEYYSPNPADTWYTLDITALQPLLNSRELRTDFENLVGVLDFNPSIYEYLPARRLPALSRIL